MCALIMAIQITVYHCDASGESVKRSFSGFCTVVSQLGEISSEYQHQYLMMHGVTLCSYTHCKVNFVENLPE